MKEKLFCTLLGETYNYTDRDAFVSDAALSPDWGEGADLAATAELCGKIWDIAHLTIRDIRRASGLSQAAFGARHLIPTRTIENWESGSRECPAYTRLLLAHWYGLDEGLR